MQIQRIIEKRKPFAHNITDAQSSLARIIRQYKELRGLCRNALADESLSEERKAVDKIFSAFSLDKAEELAHDLENIQKRLSRDTLNIAVIGKARQGKSRLLRTITGLSQYEIPDNDGPVCTGVRSDIVNDPDAPEAWAYVDFLSEDDFVQNVIGPYFRELKKHDSRINIPANIEDFMYCMIPDRDTFTTEDIRDETRMRIYIGELEKLRSHLSDYRQFLGKGRSSRIPRDKIRSYVVQQDLDTGEPIYTHLAVDRVEIHCKFPKTGAASLRLIDLPGLGDTRMGDTERMIEALSDQVDLVFFVTMPSGKGSDVFEEDINLYSQARRALGRKLPIERWSFWVLNHKEDEDNLKQCGVFAEALRNKNVRVASIITANCTSDSEVSEQLITPALDFLEVNIERNDREYARSLQDMMNSTVKSFRSVVSEASKIFTGQNNFEKDSELFDRLFDDLWFKLNAGLGRCVRISSSKLVEARETPCAALEDELRRTINAEKDAANQGQEINGITREVVEDTWLNSSGYEAAHSDLLTRLRSALSRRMQQNIDAVIRREVLIPMQEYLCEVLAKSGKLDTHFKAHGREILDELIEFSGQHTDAMPSIYNGLVKFKNADINCETRIMPLIAKPLDLLNPDKEESKLMKGRLNSADGIFESLIDIYKTTLDELEGRLMDGDIYTEPNRIAFEIAQNFVDSMTNPPDSPVRIDTQWRALYRYIRSDVWPEQIGATQIRRDAYARIREPLNSALSMTAGISVKFAE